MQVDELSHCIVAALHAICQVPVASLFLPSASTPWVSMTALPLTEDARNPSTFAILANLLIHDKLLFQVTELWNPIVSSPKALLPR
jgi:hypothetical protein